MIRIDRRVTWSIALLLTGVLAACSGGPDSSAEAAPGAALPEGHPAISPDAAAAAGVPDGPVGVVLETVDAAGYTYARLAAMGEEIWAAGPVTPISVGDTISLAGAMGMTDVHSSALDRTFESILFLNAYRAGASSDPAMMGTVLESIRAAGYTYVQVDVEGEAVWLAGPEMEIAEGQTVSWSDGQVMQNFSSRTLDRTFDAILFVPRLRIVE